MFEHLQLQLSRFSISALRTKFVGSTTDLELDVNSHEQSLESFVRWPRAPRFGLLAIGVAVLSVLSGGYWLLSSDGPDAYIADTSMSKRSKTIYLADDLAEEGVAPIRLRAGLDWQRGRLGVALTWDRIANKIRIYRMPPGNSKYTELSGMLGAAFDSYVTPGRDYTYVLCSAEQQQEYCSRLMTYRVPFADWR